MIFLATPITPLLNSTNIFGNRNKEKLSHIIASVREYTQKKVFCAIEREKWGQDLMPPHVCTRLDLQGMIDSDFVLAFPSMSYGVHVELGWASALNKPIILMINRNEGFKSPLVEGVNTIVPTTIIEFESDSPFPDELTWTNEIVPKLVKAIKIMELRNIKYEQNAL